ncbi:MAG: antitoxin Xre/MbcA/ParS toxin-binding domain-containing protein [Nitrosotalea sp.]
MKSLEQERANIKNDRETMKAYEKVLDKTNDRDKANQFMYEPNKALGGKSPLQIIGEGKAKELNRQIDIIHGRRR